MSSDRVTIVDPIMAFFSFEIHWRGCTGCEVKKENTLFFPVISIARLCEEGQKLYSLMESANFYESPTISLEEIKKRRFTDAT